MAGEDSNLHKMIQRCPVNSGSVRAGVRVQGPHWKPCDSGGLRSDLKATGVPVLQTQSPVAEDQGQMCRSGSQTVQGGVRLAIGVFRAAESTWASRVFSVQ